MSLTVNAKTYVQDTARTPDSFRYTGPSHDLTDKDMVDLKRVAPKPSSDSEGVGRSECKLTRTATDGTEDLGVMIFNFTSSVPVGTQDADIDAGIDDLAAFAATSAFKDLVKKQMIRQ